MMKEFGTPGPPPGPQEATAVLEQVRGLLAAHYLSYFSFALLSRYLLYGLTLSGVQIANGNDICPEQILCVFSRQMEAIVGYKPSNILARAQLV